MTIFSPCKRCKNAVKTLRINRTLPPPDSIHYIPPQPIIGADYIEALAERADLAGMIELATTKPLHDLEPAQERRAKYLKLHHEAMTRAKWTPVQTRADKIAQQAQRYLERVHSAERTLARLHRENADARSDRAMLPLQLKRLHELDQYLTATPCPHANDNPRKHRRASDDLQKLCSQLAPQILETYEYSPEQGLFLNTKTGLFLNPRFENATTIAGHRLPWRWIAGTLIAPNLPRPVKSRAPKGANRWVRRNLSF